MEPHMPLEEDAETLGKDMTSVTEMLVAATSKRNGPVDWNRVRVIFEQANGLPARMSDEADTIVEAARIIVQTQ